MCFTHSTGVYRTQRNAHLILGLRHGIFMGQFNIQISDYFSNKNVTFTLQVMKSQANILFPSKYHFTDRLSCQYFLLLTNFMISEALEALM